MENSIETRVCPVENAGTLDNKFRKLLQNPEKILKPYVTTGMTVLDLGCGPGFFSIEIAKLVGNTGKVIAADLQDGMLEKLNNKILGTELAQRILLHKCQPDTIALNEKVDFALAFYMVHEVPNKATLFAELKSLLKPNGKLLIIEPKFHVKKDDFGNMLEQLDNTGFQIVNTPKIFLSRAVLVTV